MENIYFHYFIIYYILYRFVSMMYGHILHSDIDTVIFISHQQNIYGPY